MSTKEQAHTAGPWYYAGQTVSTPESCVGTIHQNIGRGEVVAHVSGEKATANARLIAAAPELLAALKMLDKWFSPTGSSVRSRWVRIPLEDRVAIIEAARAAIAKAEGRS